MIVVATERPIDLASPYGAGSATRTSRADVAIALARLSQPVGILTVTDAPPPMESPTIALHAGYPTDDLHSYPLETLFARESSRAVVTVSLDLHAHPPVDGDIETAKAQIDRQIHHADIVTATDRDLARLYPGIPPAAIAMYWHDEGVACCAITSRRDGALLVAPNGVTYRHTFPTIPAIDDDQTASAFTAGLLAALADIDALGSDPRSRLIEVGPQQWLSVLSKAALAGRLQPSV